MNNYDKIRDALRRPPSIDYNAYPVCHMFDRKWDAQDFVELFGTQDIVNFEIWAVVDWIALKMWLYEPQPADATRLRMNRLNDLWDILAGVRPWTESKGRIIPSRSHGQKEWPVAATIEATAFRNNLVYYMNTHMDQDLCGPPFVAKKVREKWFSMRTRHPKPEVVGSQIRVWSDIGWRFFPLKEGL